MKHSHKTANTDHTFGNMSMVVESRALHGTVENYKITDIWKEQHTEVQMQGT